jgi:tripartite-type tricarboxylate transporter receptor subunit TctC
MESHLQNPSHPMYRRTLLVGGAGLAWASLARPAWAQEDYPSKPITVIVPYAPGGQGDVFARLIGDRLGRELKQPMIVDNRPGATGALGARLMAKAKGDGYTLMMGQTGEIAVNGSFMKSPGYDALKDFKPVALVGDAPLVMAAPIGAPYNTLQELLQMARAKPGSVSYGSSGTATPGHLAGAALALGTKTDMVHIPYKGAGQAMTDLIGGQVQFFFSSASAVMTHIKGGKLKALAVSTPKRIAALPQTPTVAEVAVPGFNFSLWAGYFAPESTPDAIINLLNREINKILLEPELRARFNADSSAIEPGSPAQFASYVQNEIKKYAVLLKAAGVQPE